MTSDVIGIGGSCRDITATLTFLEEESGKGLVKSAVFWKAK
jgi:hypothetical protein